MNRPVVDASALLATLYNEPGAEVVDAILRSSVISAVNAAEVISKLVERGMQAGMARTTVEATGVEVVSFDLDQAVRAGGLRKLTRAFGLSLGDRACLALAAQTGGRVVTADRVWAGIEGLGIELEVIRGGH